MSCIVCVTCGEIKTPLLQGKIYRMYACRKCLKHFKTLKNIQNYHHRKELNNDGFNTNQLKLRFN
jgi:hypothetical protein